MKKLTAMFLVLTMLFCTSASACDASEADVTSGEAKPEVTSSITATPNPVFIPITEDTVLITPFASRTPVSNKPITEDGAEWYQEEGYPAFRIWVQNDTDEEMKVTIEYDGMPHNGEMVFRVPAHQGGGGYVNFAEEGTYYYVDFQTPNGTFAGSCTVRISTTPFG